MKTKNTYKAILIAGSLFFTLFFNVSVPVTAAPPAGYSYFHASFHAGASYYMPVVSYSTRIRMFVYPSVMYGYIYDPVYVDPWYGGGGYYYGGGYGYFSVTFSYGYPAYYIPSWSYYPSAWYYPPVHIWSYHGPYYSYRYDYGWHGGCGYPYYDRHYHSYGSRAAAYAAGDYRPSGTPAWAYSNRGRHAGTSSGSYYGVRSRNTANSSAGSYARHNAVSSGKTGSRAGDSRGSVAAGRRTVSHNRSTYVSQSSVRKNILNTSRYRSPAHASRQRRVSAPSGSSSAIPAYRRTGPGGNTHRTATSSYSRRSAAAAYRNTPAATNRSGSYRNTPATVRHTPMSAGRRATSAAVKEMHAPSRPAHKGMTPARKSSSSRTVTARRR